MGITHAEGTLTGPTGKQATVRFLVDSNAIAALRSGRTTAAATRG